MFLLISFVIADYSSSTHGIYSIYLKAGKYTVGCYGAQGGKSYTNGNENKNGGQGAYVTGTMTITGTGTYFYAHVGGEGTKSPGGPNPGGFNGGGFGGKDFGGTGNDASGGGGGATDLRINDNSRLSRIMVAAGGSGAAYDCEGAYGGFEYGKKATKNGVFDDSPDVSIYKGGQFGFGGNGKDGDHTPGSGGGGGWFGGPSSGDSITFSGDSYKAVAHSGSSYISGLKGTPNPKMTFTSGSFLLQAKTGDGKIYISTIFECSPNCHSCSSATECTKCFDGYLMDVDKTCTKTCSKGTVGSNGQCIPCDENCSECVNTKSECTKCKTGYVLHESTCIAKCPNGLYDKSGECLACIRPCEKCETSADRCISCIEGFSLYNNKCYSVCPTDTRQNGDRCEKCQSHCASCFSSLTDCTSCESGYYLYNNECRQSCPDSTVIYNNQCVECQPPCTSCSSLDHCTSCLPGYYMHEGKCLGSCVFLNDKTSKSSFGIDAQNQECVKCQDSHCINCIDDYTQCNECEELYHVESGVCVHNPTEVFTGSSAFTFSELFSSSKAFTKSAGFDETSGFSESQGFSRSEETTSEISSEETTSEISSEETTSEISSEETTSETSSEETTSEISSEETTSEISSEETTSETSSEETTSEISSEETTSEISSEETTSETSSEETTSETSSEETTSETSSEETTSETSSEETTSETSSEETTSETSSEETTSEISSEETTSEISSEEMTEQIPTEDPFPQTNALCSALYNNKNVTIYNRCYFTINVDETASIQLLKSNFSDFKNESSGGAIYIENCMMELSNTNFTSCVSVSGGGGAIYVKNSMNLVNHLTFENLYFSHCRAIYGGAVYVYSSQKHNNVTFNLCKFESNEASSMRYDDKNQLFGGSAVFLTSNQCFVTECKFILNSGKGASFKVYAKFDENDINSLILEESQNSNLNILGCSFENRENSKNAIFLISEKEGNQIQIQDCRFKGKLKEGEHYIDGRFVGSKDSAAVQISSCKFEYEMNVSVNSNLIVDPFSIKDNISLRKTSTILLIFIIFVVVSALFIFIKNFAFSKHEKKDNFSIEIDE